MKETKEKRKPMLVRCTACGGFSEEPPSVTQAVESRDVLLKALKTIAEYCEAEGSPIALSVALTSRNAIAKATGQSPKTDKTCACGESIEEWENDCFWCARQERREEIADLRHEEHTDGNDTEL